MRSYQSHLIRRRGLTNRGKLGVLSSIESAPGNVIVRHYCTRARTSEIYFRVANGFEMENPRRVRAMISSRNTHHAELGPG